MINVFHGVHFTDLRYFIIFQMTQLQDRSMELESLCKARRAEAWERSQTYLIFQEKYTEVSVARNL